MSKKNNILKLEAAYVLVRNAEGNEEDTLGFLDDKQKQFLRDCMASGTKVEINVRAVDCDMDKGQPHYWLLDEPLIAIAEPSITATGRAKGLFWVSNLHFASLSDDPSDPKSRGGRHKKAVSFLAKHVSFRLVWEGLEKIIGWFFASCGGRWSPAARPRLRIPHRWARTIAAALRTGSRPVRDAHCSQ